MRFIGYGLGYEIWYYEVEDLLTAPEGTRLGETVRHYVYLPVAIMPPERQPTNEHERPVQ